MVTGKQLEIIRNHWWNFPRDFCVDVFGDKIFDYENPPRSLISGDVYLFDKSIEIMDSVRKFKRTAVKACFSSSKTFTAARLVLWFMVTRLHSKVITTAPTNRQVEDLLWNEIAVAYKKAAMRGVPIGGRLLTKELKNVGGDANWFATGFTTDEYDPQKFQGYHAPDIFIVVDEANGIPKNIFNSIDKLMTSEGAKLLLIGNPINPSGEFYDAFTKNSSLFNKITIKAVDTPNIKLKKVVIPGMISMDWINEMVTKHGKDSPFYSSGVEAEFPASAANTLIPLEWIEAANKRWNWWHGSGKVPKNKPFVLSVDPGEYGDDPTAYLYRVDNIVTEMKRIYKQGLMQTAATIQEAHSLKMEIVVDTLGIGAGIGSRLDELDIPFTHYRGGSGTKFKDATGNFGFDNIRTAAYWKLREALNPDGEIKLRIPPNDDLRADLTTIDFKIKTGIPPKIAITSKEEVKKKLGRSPDYGDALAMSVYHMNIAGEIADGDYVSTQAEIKKEANTRPRENEGPEDKKPPAVRGNYSGDRRSNAQRKSLIFG